MQASTMIKQGLHLHCIPVIESDLKYIHNVLQTINQAQTSLDDFPMLHEKAPITVVDPEVIQFD
ncbi:hypothetical protein [Alkalihalobacillus sp. LMS39]|uniref:hypothetical protein n=1 Tax=Alkalihalobacillus sp. LMS39 TaxID=2924032 RepID=UPI001FB4699E|nr:hypothetical protein [Alkalihalobacillus sp. LMS39]UOE94647.1 hypothetical protein MM271_03090 [Alkalihalobacillus sp. LMS39]